MTRGLRDCSITPRAIASLARNASQNTEKLQGGSQNHYEIGQSSRNFSQDVEERDNLSFSHNTKTQESQTEITTVEDVKSSNRQMHNEASGSQSSVLHALVDHLAQALNVPKSQSDRGTETERIHSKHRKISDVEQIDSDPLSNDSVSSSESSPRDNFEMPREMYRSVGVGAEFDDAQNQLPTTSYSKPTINEVQIEDEPSFRAHVEIECALHLPKVEKPEGPIEPSTYVTFQPVQRDNGTQFGPYKVTNIFTNSCSPKWEWRCDTRLSADLLINVTLRLFFLSTLSRRSLFYIDYFSPDRIRRG